MGRHRVLGLTLHSLFDGLALGALPSRLACKGHYA